jgi:O-antigen ligase
MSSEPPIAAPTGELPPKPQVVDESKPNLWLNLICFFLPLAACWFGPRAISFIIGMFWPLVLVVGLLFFALPSFRIRRSRWAYLAFMLGLTLGCYLVVQKHFAEFDGISNVPR